METTIPAELLRLKTRFDQWRATRNYNREPMPAELRQAAVEICRRSPRAPTLPGLDLVPVAHKM